jgi:quercetin dioxygenase-like cupin family protein
MVILNQKRRSVLLGLAGLGVGHALLPSAAEAEGAASQGYVLGPAEGEHLVHFRNPGNIFIKVDPLKGSKNLAIGTQQVPVGAGIPIHIHFETDEAFYILEGSGSFILNDVPLPFEKGGTIFIPKNSWHGFKNPDQELLLLWMVTPTGLDAFFRETCSPPGIAPKKLTKEQINEIAGKYATKFK